MATVASNPQKPRKLKAEQSQDYAFPWMPDQGDGTYRNPIIYADYSDPDVIRVGDDFYLTASSFNCTPGLPILHSKDLVNWTIIGHALKNLPHSCYNDVQPGCGVWAPAIRFHQDKFWIFFATPDEGIYFVTADHPAGEWSQPHLVQEGKGLIDPCPLWDDNGKAYLVHAYAHSRCGIKHMLRVCPMAPNGSKLLGAGEIVFHDPERHPTIEGPKFLKRDGWYYILAPAGGVESGWQVALRSKHLYGPYEARILLAQGSTDINGPHQGALVDTQSGDVWFIHFQDAGVYGRLVHLQPVRWQDDWPLIGNQGQPVLHHPTPLTTDPPGHSIPQTTDEFAAPQLGFQWQWHANHRDDWGSSSARPGWLRLFPLPAVSASKHQPNLLLQKFPARSFTVETLLELHPHQPGEEAGLVVTGQSQAMLGLHHVVGKNRIILRLDDDVQTIAEVTSNIVIFRAHVSDGGNCSFAFSNGSAFHPIPHTFQAKKGVWIGAKIGLYSVKNRDVPSAGYADVDYFRFA